MPRVGAAARRGTCALCGSGGLVDLFEREGFPIARCPACGLVQVDLKLGRAELEEIYDKAYFTSDVFHDYIGERDIRIADGAVSARRLARIVPGGRLLDVGCAAGFFLVPAAEYYDVTGVEISSFASDYARRTFGLRVLTGDVRDVDLQGEQFDVVTMWNTIEHMSDPLESLLAVASLVKPGGLLALSTGDASGLLARHDLHDWNLMSPPHHLSFFSPKTIDLLLAKAGFRLRRIAYDGVVATSGPLATVVGRRLAMAFGLGNVMTVYASRSRSALPALTATQRLLARYRPLSFTLPRRAD